MDHDRALELAAAAIDFGLSPADDAALTDHLASCPTCQTTVAALNADAAALAGLEHLDAPANLRDRVLQGTSPATVTDAPTPDKRKVIAFPKRYRRPALLAAAAAVAVAVVGLTLPWRGTAPTGNGGVAVVSTPSPSSESSAPPGSPGPGGPTDPPDELMSGHEQLATITADEESGGVVGLGTSFRLGALGSRSAQELAKELSVQPRIAMTTTVEPDGRVRLTPTEPLTPGVVYRFELAGSDGQVVDSWAFQARQPLRVVTTLPYDTATEVQLDSGIEVTFDQDGVVDAADHVAIEPPVKGRFEQHGRVLSFVPDRLEPATVYTVTVSPGVRVDATGEELETPTRFRFETAAKNDGTRATSYFQFSNDLFESATADRPVVGLWWTDENGGPDSAPAKIRLEVYRFAEQGAAIEAFQQLRDVPRWSLFNRAERVPTDGLQHVAGLDAPLQDSGGTLWTTLHDAVPAGWYLVENPSDSTPAQTIVQVTDVAAYLAVSGTRTVVWANDLASRRPIAGATVRADGDSVGQTGADGLLVFDTPDALRTDQVEASVTAGTPIVTITAGGRSAFLPGTGAGTPDGRRDTGTDEFWEGPGDPTYWLIFDTDRTLYRHTDTINAWGAVRERSSNAVPDSVTMRLVAEGGSEIPVASTQASPRQSGAFSGSLVLRDVPQGEYRLELVVSGKPVISRYVRVDRILKPAYRIDLVTGRRVYIVGDRIRITASASFYEGTPVPGVPLQLGGEFERAATTDATGTAVVRTTARWDQEERSEPRHTMIEARPARAEEGEIVGASREFVIFPSSWIVNGDASVQGGRVRVTGTANELDRDRVEREIASGKWAWEVDPNGAGLARRAVRARIVEQIPIRKRSGTSYDFIEKRVVPVYEYDVRERLVGTLRLTTDGRGRFAGSIAAPDVDHTYRVELSVTDPDGLRSTATAWASREIGVDESDAAPSIVRTDLRSPDTDEPVEVGQSLRLRMVEPRAGGSVDSDPHLFVTAQAGIRQALVQSSARLDTSFPAWGPPNVAYRAVRFTGHGYVAAGPYIAMFRASDRELTVRLSTDQERYAPGGQVHLSVQTSRIDGRPTAASVVVRAVDEKLFSIGGAEDDDPLAALYSPLPSGYMATYATHGGPSSRFEGGDTTGGGGDGSPNDAILFRTVDTDERGRATLTFDLPADLTSWRVSASAISGELEAGRTSMLVPVGVPFFVDTSIAPEYLVSDRPTIQLRGFGSGLAQDARVGFTVDAATLGFHRTGLVAPAFRAVSVALPKLRLGTHRITITARTGSGSSARTHTVTRTIDVVASRLTRTRTSYVEPTEPGGIDGGGDVTDLVVADAGVARQLETLMGLAGSASTRLERALAADVAAEILGQRSVGAEPSTGGSTFDGDSYQQEDGGIALLPHASSDLEVSALAALVAPERFSGDALGGYLNAVVASGTETRERRNLALAGLAGLGRPVLSMIRAAADDGELTIRERAMLAIGAARLGDLETARAAAGMLAERYGEALGAEARLRVGDEDVATTTATAMMAMLLGALADPLAGRYWAYVDGNPTEVATFDLYGLAYARWTIDRADPAPARFAYAVAGARHVVDLAPGETLVLRLTKAQQGGFSLEPIDGRIGVTSVWREPIGVGAIKKDRDITVTRTVRPSGTIASRNLVVVDLVVRFGRGAPNECHGVTELVPSGLVPVGVLWTWTDPETGETPADVVYPEAQAGQRVLFCATPSDRQRTLRLRYVARVITVGLYRWEPAVVESRTDAERGAVVPARSVRIR